MELSLAIYFGQEIDYRVHFNEQVNKLQMIP